MKTAFTWIGIIVGTLVLVFLLGLGGLEWKKFFAPRHAEVNRTVFENTPSFVHGKAQHLTKLRFEFEQAETDSQRNSLKMMIRHEASTIDNDLLPTDLQSFIQSL